MTEPHIDHASEERGPTPMLKRLGFVIILAGLCGLMLGGCDNFWETAGDLIRIDGNDAEAQTDTEQRIEVYAVSTDTFSIIVDNDGDATPTFIVRDSATEFTMQSGGTVSFDTSSGRDTDLEVETGDVIIFRPNGTTGTVTLIRVD